MFHTESYPFTLPSGVEMEVRRLKGKHQEWLTKGRAQKRTVKTNGGASGEKTLVDVLMDCTVTLGGRTSVTRDDIRRMLSADFAYAILVLRFFSTDIYFAERMEEKAKWDADMAEAKKAAQIAGEPWDDEEHEFESQYPKHIFRFKYDYEKETKNGKKKVGHEYEVELYLWDFPVKNYPGEKLPSYDKTAVDAFRKRSLTLPISKQEVYWDVLNVETEEKYKKLFDDKEMDSSTSLKCRRPVTNDEGGTVLQLDLSELEVLDIEELRGDINKSEGNVDTRFYVKHPDDEEETIPIQAPNVVAFFFPSGVL